MTRAMHPELIDAAKLGAELHPEKIWQGVWEEDDLMPQMGDVVLGNYVVFQIDQIDTGDWKLVSISAYPLLRLNRYESGPTWGDIVPS